MNEVTDESEQKRHLEEILPTRGWHAHPLEQVWRQHQVAPGVGRHVVAMGTNDFTLGVAVMLVSGSTAWLVLLLTTIERPMSTTVRLRVDGRRGEDRNRTRSAAADLQLLLDAARRDPALRTQQWLQASADGLDKALSTTGDDRCVFSGTSYQMEQHYCVVTPSARTGPHLRNRATSYWSGQSPLSECQ